MSKKRMVFPMDVQQGSVVVKIYRVKNKSYRHKTKDNTVKLTDRYGFMVSFFAKRRAAAEDLCQIRRRVCGGGFQG